MGDHEEAEVAEEKVQPQTAKAPRLTEASKAAG